MSVGEKKYALLIQALLGVAVLVLIAGGLMSISYLWPQWPLYFGEWGISFLDELPENLQFLGSRVTENWKGFLGLSPVTGTLTTRASLSDIELGVKVNQLVEERLAEILAEVTGEGEIGSAVSVGGPRQGMVVVPSTGSTIGDRLLRQRLQQIFSDPVTFQVDPGGGSGVVTPLFKEGAGSDFLFLLTPVRAVK